MAGALSGLAVVVGLGLLAWALTRTGGDGRATLDTVGDRTTATGGTTAPATTARTGEGGVSIGDNVSIGGNVSIGRGSGTPKPLADADSHLLAPLCQGANPPATVEVVNRHSGPVDYRLHLYHLDKAGVRVGESFGSLHGVAPGEHALLSAQPLDEPSASCTVDYFTATPDDPARTVDRANATITQCKLDTFFGNFWDIAFTVKNPTNQTVDAEVTFTVVDANGLIIGEVDQATVSNMAPGQTVKETASGFVSTVKQTDRKAARCAVALIQLQGD